jgi:2-oxoglutarate ferredoxin oxidoreductase subunit beta
VHDEASPEAGLGFLLSQLQAPEFPLPLGIFRKVNSPGYEELCADQAAAVIADKGKGRLESLLQGGASWTVSTEH